MFSPLVLLLASLAAFAGNLTVDVLDVGQGDAVLLPPLLDRGLV